ncbi:ImpA family type VI secretion system protein [Paraburkholderia bryophila]|uniref:Type VI secretion system ImpA family protein n=1 Tax=Paraburkholderia bryophila TaxID=420952 RepID=A0A329CEN7_9BURK|nr:type VI secretion system ImpA family N-terminal domain-containing protein [Paraburkholderia bryophila]RAS33263.1 type VI secretion system ImpA family protein [Paraburkholderia bryophila]
MEHPLDYANGFLSAAYGMTCATLLAPVSIAQPQGETLRGTPVWHAIRRAREADDASLPLGAWVRQLKRANWGEVASASLDALAHRSKDLHLAVWLTEALLHEHGFAGLAAGISVVDALCERYWDVLYPGVANGDFEHRANLFRWLNEKLIAPVRLVPLTVAGTVAVVAAASAAANGVGLAAVQPQPSLDEPERRYAWADCEQLRRQQQSPQSGSRGGDEGGIDSADFDKTLAATSTEVFIAHHAALSQALAALARLGATLDQCFDGDPPGVGALRGVLEQIHAFVSAQLVQRGMPFGVAARAAGAASAAAPAQGYGHAAYAEAGVVPLTDTISVAVSMAGSVNANTDGGAYSVAAATAAAANVDSATQAAVHHASDHAQDHAAPPTLRDEASALPHSVSGRKRAYAQLADAAAALAELEPHSPVPYLIRKAVEWGTLNTAQLYDELFIQGRGQLNVFDLLGLGVPQAEEQAS